MPMFNIWELIQKNNCVTDPTYAHHYNKYRNTPEILHVLEPVPVIYIVCKKRSVPSANLIIFSSTRKCMGNLALKTRNTKVVQLNSPLTVSLTQLFGSRMACLFNCIMQQQQILIDVFLLYFLLLDMLILNQKLNVLLLKLLVIGVMGKMIVKVGRILHLNQLPNMFIID